jgi:hypothetical protein
MSDNSERRAIEHAMAVEIFKKESHLDPQGDTDLEAADWGFSKLDDYHQQFYLSVANTLYAWLCTTGWTLPRKQEPPPRPPHQQTFKKP